MRENSFKFGSGQGQGSGQGNRAGLGPTGKCVCPNCGFSASHQPGMPCSSQKCPKCGISMIRE